MVESSVSLLVSAVSFPDSLRMIEAVLCWKMCIKANRVCLQHSVSSCQPRAGGWKCSSLSGLPFVLFCGNWICMKHDDFWSVLYWENNTFVVISWYMFCHFFYKPPSMRRAFFHCQGEVLPSCCCLQRWRKPMRLYIGINTSTHLCNVPAPVRTPTGKVGFREFHHQHGPYKC